MPLDEQTAQAYVHQALREMHQKYGNRPPGCLTILRHILFSTLLILGVIALFR